MNKKGNKGEENRKIAIIILNWNGKKDTLECLSSIRKLSTDGFPFSIIVVDNASTDDSLTIIKKEFPEVILLKNSQNLGFAEGNNVGIRYALKDGADFIVILNNDTILEKNCLKNLVHTAESHKDIGIIGPKIYFAPNYEFHKERYKKEEKGKVIWYAGGIIDWDNILCSHRGVDEVDKGQFDKAGETDFVSGCCMLVKKEVFTQIGIFDPKYFLYLEDVDLCQRARKHGWKIYYEPKAMIWHKNASSSGGPGSVIHNYYLTRNRLLFGMRYGSVYAKLALLRETLRLFKKNFPGERNAIKDFFLGKFGRMKF